MAKASKFHYGDKIKSTDGSLIGTIKFIGERTGKEGVWYGIDLTKGDGKNNGSEKNIQYFKTRGNKKSGRFLRQSKIKLSKKNNVVEFTINDRVLCTKSNPPTHGIIRYVGIPAFPNVKKIQYGIQLESENGTCDGSIKGIGYFSCNFKSKYGIYCRLNEVKKAKDKTGNKKVKLAKNKSLPKSPKTPAKAKKQKTENNLNKTKRKSKKKLIKNDDEKESNKNKEIESKASKHKAANSGNVGTGNQVNYNEKEKNLRMKWGKNTFLEVYSSSMAMWCPAHIQQEMLKNEQQPIDIFLVFYTNQNGEEFTKYLDRWSPYLRPSTVPMSPIPKTPTKDD